MFNSKGDNLRISLIQTSLVVSDYRMQKILGVFRGPHTMTFNLQSVPYVRMRIDSLHSKSLHKNNAR